MGPRVLRARGRRPLRSPQTAAQSGGGEDFTLSARSLRLVAGSGDFDFDVQGGTIVGLAGLEGQGHEVLLRVLAGLDKPAAGSITVHLNGCAQLLAATQRSAAAAGISYLPRDRRAEGIFGDLSLLDNFAIKSLGQFTRVGLLRRKALLAAFEEARQDLDIVAGKASAPITSLSGGNQQKLLLGRLLLTGPRCLLLNDPCRGIDIHAKLTLHRAFRAFATDQGASVVLLSSELAEIREYCDEVAVFHNYSLMGRGPCADYSEADLLSLMFGERPPHGPISLGANQPRAED